MPKPLFGDGWSTSGVNPDDLSETTVESHKYDHDDYRRLLKEVRAFKASHGQLSSFAETGSALFQDAWTALFKVRPSLKPGEEVKPGFLQNHQVMAQLFDVDQYNELHYYTRGDDVAAAMAAVDLEPTLEQLLDMLGKRKQEADEFEDLLRRLLQARQEQQDIDDLVAKWLDDNQPEPAPPGEDDGDGGSGEEGGEEGGEQGCEGEGQPQPCGQPGDLGEGGVPGPGSGGIAVPGELAGQQAQAQAKVAGIEQQIRELEKQLARNAAIDAGSIRQQLAEAMSEAAGKARDLQQHAQAWGIEPGQLTRMPADARMKLAKKISTPFLRQVAEKIGAIQRVVFEEQSKKSDDRMERLVDIETGRDLERIMPSELIRLRDPRQKWGFLKDYAEGNLLQYRMDGEEQLGKGGIIYCGDGSASMRGEPAIWNGALMVAFLHIARSEQREFTYIHFGSVRQVQVFEFKTQADFTVDRIIEAVEYFWNGGTDFVSPLNVALKKLQQEFDDTGKVKGDIVFATDGLCPVPDDYLEMFDKKRAELEFRLWGIAITHHQSDEMAKTSEPLRTLADGRVAVVKDLLGGGDVREVFAAL